jgi:hypothetical protein
MQISLKKIREKGACSSGQRWFKNHFGTRSVPVTRVLKALLKRKQELNPNYSGYSKWMVASFCTQKECAGFMRTWWWTEFPSEGRKMAIKWAIENVK